MWDRRLVATTISLVILVLSASVESRKKEPKIITEPRPGEEYVYFQKGSPRVLETTSFVQNKNDSNLLGLLSGSILRPQDHLSIDESPFDILHESTQPPAEVQTEVSVVTSKAVYVDGPLVFPEAQTGVIKDASEDEAAQRKVAPKIPSVIVKPTFKKFQDVAFDTSEVRNVRVHLESSDGVLREHVKLLPGDVGVPIQHHPDDIYSVTATPDITTYHPTTSLPTTSARGSTLTTTEIPFTTIFTDQRESKSNIGAAAENLFFGKEGENSDFKFGSKGSPLDDKILVPAETAQATRVNIKKAPNGKEYEYEYVYYYYDDDDEGAGKNVNDTTHNDVSDAAAAAAAPFSNSHDGPGVEDLQNNKNNRALFGTDDVDAPDVEDVQTTFPPSTTTTTTTTTAAPTTTVPTTTPSTERQSGGRRYLPNSGSANRLPVDDSSVESLRAPLSRSRDYIRTRDSSVETTTPEAVQVQYQGRKHLSRGRHHQSATAEIDVPATTSPARGGSGRYRYTSIERTRDSGSSKEEQETSFDSDRASSNDVLPSRGGSRFASNPRARQPISSSEEDVSPLHSRNNYEEPVRDISEERLPQVTRFPARRPNPTTATAAVSNAPEQAHELYHEPLRSQSSPHVRGGAVRPSLELVDSSSFRTSAGPGGPIPALHGGFLPAFPSVPGGPGAPVRFLGVNPEDLPHSSPAPFRPHLIPLIPDDETHISRSTTPSYPALPPASHVPFYTPGTIRIEDTEVTTLNPAGKSVYDFYAIVKVRENAVDSTSPTVSNAFSDESEESSTESNNEEITTTLVPTTTTTPATTTTTTTLAPTTTPKSGRSRSRVRPGSSSPPLFSSGARTRSRRPNSGTSTTEATVDEHSSTSRPRGRFQSSRNGGLSSSRGSSFRRTTTSKPDEADADAQGEDKVSPSPRPSIRAGNRFRTGNRVTSSGNTSSSSAVPSSPSSLPSRPTFADRYNLRRRGPSSSTTTTTTEEPQVNTDTQPDDAEEPQNLAPTPSAPKIVSPGSRIRNRVHLSPSRSNTQNRPGLGNRISPHLRSRPGAPAPVQPVEVVASEEADTPGVTNSPDAENTSPEVVDVDSEVHVDSDETVTTTPASTLNRLRNRPRLRITDKHANHKATSSAPQNRKQLVSSLLPRRRPVSQEEQSSQESDKEHSASEEETQPEEETPSSAQEEVRPTLLNRKRARRPGTLHLNRAPTVDDESS